MYRIIGKPINLRKIIENIVIHPELSEGAKRIIRIAEFGLKHGYKAAIDAFGVSKTTYYTYLQQYRVCREHGLLLTVKSKRPHNLRKPSWDKRLVKFIRILRKQHPNLGKDKIKYYLDKFCIRYRIKTISKGTIQNIINSFPNKLRTKKSVVTVKHRNNVLRKPAKYKALFSGECLSMDSMEFRQGGKKLYVVVALDEATNLMYAKATNSHTSRSTINILEASHNYLPWSKFNIILTDNGSEFEKDFRKYVEEHNIIHYRTYPKTPKQNARCERANRTIQDEFMISYGNLLFEDISLFNKQLEKYLRWYNFERVHSRFNNQMTPFERHLELTNNAKIMT